VGVQKLMFPSGADPLQVSPTDSKLIYANITGDRVGVDSDPVWLGISKSQRYFEIMLLATANPNLSPPDNNPVSSSYSFCVVSVRVSSPAYQGDDSNPINTPRWTRSNFIYNMVVLR